MRFQHCPDCGSLLSHRDLGDEKDVPWCDCCSKPWFDMFPSAVIVLVYNDRGEVLLLRQDYISTHFCNLVSGYIVPGENAETCAVREVFEETGLSVDRLELQLTSWFAKKEMMMIGFFAHVSQTDLALSSEVNSAAWHPAGEILGLLSTLPGSTSRLLASRFLSNLKQ